MIRRYTVNAPDTVFLPWGDEIKTGASIDPDSHFGEWCKYEDVAAMEAELIRLRALGLPDVAELQREVERLRSEREALLAVLEPAGNDTLAHVLLYAAQDSETTAKLVPRDKDVWLTQASKLKERATAIDAALKGVKENG